MLGTRQTPPPIGRNCLGPLACAARRICHNHALTLARSSRPVIGGRMKIVDPSSIRGPAAPRRADRSGARSGEFARHMEDTSATGASSSASGLSAAAGVAGILSLQEVDDRGASRRRAVLRADTLLDKLDELRHGLLMGTLTRSQLAELERLVSVRRGDVDDPQLNELLDDIDLRVQVEIAKYEYETTS